MGSQMTAIQAIVGALAVGLVALNLYATYRAVRDALSGRGQKAAQICAIWLLPIFGAIAVLYVQRSERFTSREYQESAQNLIIED